MNGAGAADGFDLTGSGAEPLRAQDPRRIGTIPLVGRLGAGGMGRVYLGVVDGRYAAVKQMLASVVAEDRGFLRRFGQEMDNLARLPAGATAPLLASDRTAEPPWFATAYVPGITLSEAVEEHGGPLPPDALWRLLREVAVGLRAVHELDMVHRDLKPSNVMLTLDGATLIDFGIARAAEQSRLTGTGLVVGTPAYMSPEQASGKRGLTSASDIFAAGLLVAYAASGRWPFADGAEGSPLYRIVHDEPDLTPVRERDPRLAEVLAACLDKDPEGRPTAPELTDLTAEHVPSPPSTWPSPTHKLLTQRTTFATTPPPTAPETDPEPKPKPSPDPHPQKPPKQTPERRRTRILMAAVPVIVVAAGTTLALQNLPYVTTPDHAAGSTPSVTTTAPAAPDSSPGTEASAKPKKKEKDHPTEKAKDEQSATPGNKAKDRTEADGHSGSDSDTNPDTGPTPASDSTPDTPDDNRPAPPPSSGTFHLRNADNEACLTQVYGAADDGSCGDPSASWKTVSAENNSFKVVNKQSGACLVANMLGQAVFVGDCTQGSARLWRWGPAGTLKSTSNGGCLDLAYGGGISATTCASGKASQRWGRS
ncbi:protein kinase [Streptomyces sp. NPDC052114]|uniref:serine/threonine-protein kinase n=1 Tax=unclassified Streptomyces TaxID=2593676 RepID=UPI003440DBE1